jgi:hypothetical protein
VYLEEYAQIDESVINLAIMPMLNIMVKGRDNQIVASTTAFYSFNHAYKQYLLFQLEKMRGNDKYYLSEYTFLDHMKIKDPPYQYDMDILERQRNDPTMTEDQFKMENLCYFPLDSHGIFSYRIMDHCTPKVDPISIELFPELKDYIFYTMGIDSARTEDGDNFAIHIMKCSRVNNTRQVVHCVALNGASYPEQEACIRRLARLFNVTRIDMDLRGGGQALKDLLAQNWVDPETKQLYYPILDIDDDKFKYMNGHRILRMFPSTQPSNNLMYTVLKGAMEKQLVQFPIDILKHGDAQLDKVAIEIIRTKRELYMLSAEPRGNMFHYDVPRGHKKDRAVALGLAHLAAQEVFEETRIVNDINNMPDGFWVGQNTTI